MYHKVYTQSGIKNKIRKTYTHAGFYQKNNIVFGGISEDAFMYLCIKSSTENYLNPSISITVRFYNIILIFMASLSMYAQTLDSVAIVRSFQIGAGRIINTLSLQENNTDVEYLTGWDFNANFLFKNLLRLEFKYTNFMPDNILPFWENAHLENFNLNLHKVISNEEGYFFIYPMIGAAYTKFSAYQKIDKNFRTINQNKTFYQLGLNAGLGVEWHIKFFSLFIDYNMRITKITPDNSPNVRNVGFALGIRLFYFQLYWHKSDKPNHKSNHKRKLKRRHLFERLNDRYHWF